MFCAKCGSKIEAGMAFCTNCGTPAGTAPAVRPPAAAAPPTPGAPPTSGYGSPAPYAYAPPAGGGMSSSSALGIVFMVLGVIAFLVAGGLSWDEAYGWAAGVFLLAAFLFLLGGFFHNQGKKAERPAMTAAPPGWQPPPQGPPPQAPPPPR